MSSDFTTFPIEDARISHIKDSIPFGVLSGAGQNTFQNFPANTASTSNIIFNVQVPSMSTVIDREVLFQARITFTINATGVPAAALALNYGLTDALQAFPFNSLISTITATINNTTVSLNQQDVFPQLLKMYDDEQLFRYNSMTPSYPDSFFLNYADGVGTNCNILAGLSNAFLNQNLMPRGCFNITMGTVVHTTAAGVVNTSLVSTDAADTFAIPITITITEPLFLSPFANNENDKAGFLGINNMVLNINLDATCKRLWSTANDYINSITLNTIQEAKLLMNFLSLQPEQYSKISAKNVLNYLDIPRYVFSSTSALASNASATVYFSNIQLNQIPDLMIIVARQPMGTQRWNNSSSFSVINKISINFNNQSGILSSSTQNQLYLLSQKNGSNQTWYEFSGYSYINTANGKGAQVSTIGSVLILNPAIDFGLLSMYSASSGGQYNFQFELNITNQSNAAYNPELVLITVNSGLFTTENGSSNTQTGILTKEVVLNAKSKSSDLDTDMYHRIIGGSLHRLRQLGNVMSSKNTDGGAVCAGDDAGQMSAGKMHKHKLHRFIKK
jgi:hypothetical protein